MTTRKRAPGAGRRRGAGNAPLAGEAPGAADASRSDLVGIGYLLRAHGIRGELLFVPLGVDPELASGLVYLRPKAGGPLRAMTVTGRRAHHGALLLSFRELADRTAAEPFKSHTLLIPRDRLPAPAEGEIDPGDLPGLLVQAQRDGAWRDLGRISRVDAASGQMLWTIACESGQEILFPAVDDFIVALDPKAGLARIAPPPGLLELYL